MTILSLMRVKSIKLHARQKLNPFIESTKESHCGFWLTLSQITITVSSVTAWTVTQCLPRYLYYQNDCVMTQRIFSPLTLMTQFTWGSGLASHILLLLLLLLLLISFVNVFTHPVIPTNITEILGFVSSSLQTLRGCLFGPMTWFLWDCSLPGPLPYQRHISLTECIK